MVILVAANKSDSAHKKKTVDPALAKAYCEGHGMTLFETSALSGENLTQLFESNSYKIYTTLTRQR